MDFVVGLPQTLRKNNVVWVIVDRLTKSAHFLPVRMTFSMDQYARIYTKEIVRLHGYQRSIVVEQIRGLHRSSDEFARSIGNETLYGRKCSPLLYWSEVGERKILGPELIEQTVEKISEIQDKIKVAQDRQKSYVDKRRKDIQFEVGNRCGFESGSNEGIIRFGKKGKLQPRYIGPFEILERVGDLAYRLALPPDLLGVHNVFHVSMLRKYVLDPEHIVNYKDLHIGKNLSYEEMPVAILDRKVHGLRNRDVVFIKVQ
ncbi:hypothetical protein DH2020_022799 [Rehmannia glutinosa]|uniref:Tf2-1-like SH3-like domain-containing protein n=1 Tax=Rehmannia glutinosa TaxID=99300 RepID=A0ABR0W6U8_REHGL